MNGGEVIFTFKGNTDDVEKKTKSLGTSLGTLLKGSVVFSAVQKGINAVSQSLDGAISRVDTLNNFPRVMSNLGIDAKASEKSIRKLSDGITGLPTTLDSAVSAVQRFTTANNDVEKSTDYFLAFNNAVLAGGASAEIQASALEQLSQMYATGTIDAQGWRSVMTAMPAQLQQVASSMGYTSMAVGGDFYEALQKGKISMDDMMQAMVKLNTEGVGNYASFAEQAKGATDGIQTSLTNLKTAVTRGVANAIDTLNKSLEENNLPNISEIIQMSAEKAGKALAKITDIIKQIMPYVAQAYQWGQKHQGLLKTLTGVVLGFVGAFKVAKLVSFISKSKEIATIIKVVGGSFKVLKAVIMGVTTVVKLLGIAITANPIGIIIAIIVAVVAAFVLLWNKCEGFRNFFIGMWEGIKSAFGTVVDWIKQRVEDIKSFFTETIPNAFNNFVSFLASIPEKIKAFIDKIPYYIGYAIGWVIGKGILLAEKIKNFFTVTIPNAINTFLTNITNFFTVTIPNLINNFIEFVKTLPERIANFFTNIWNKIVEFGQNVWTWVTTKVPEIINNIVTFFKELPGKIWTWLTDTISKIGMWISNMKTKVKTGIKQVVQSVINKFKELPGKLLNVGKNIVEGLWNGIKNAKDWLVKKIKSFAKGITDGLKDALGIHSPSKVTFEMGVFMDKGFINGMEDMQPEIQKTIDGMFDLSPSLYGNTSANLSPNVSLVVNNNIEQDPLGQMVSKVKTFSGGAKNDYNWGSGLS